MDKKRNGKLSGMTGKLPDNWEKMSLEEKISALDKKAKILIDDGMYKLCMGYYIPACDNKFWADVYIDAAEDHQFTEYGSCFALKNPTEEGKFDITAFPEYLRKFIEDNADTRSSGEKDYNMLTCGVMAATFTEAVEKMYIMLDLLSCGYEITEREWFEEKHPDLYPQNEDDKDDEL